MNYVYAQSQATCVAQGFLDTILSAVFWPLTVFLVALALLVFLYGAFKFVLNADNQSERETGRRHMIYGIIGLIVMTSALAILTIAANTFGLSIGPADCSGLQQDSFMNPGEIGSEPWPQQ